MSIVTAVSHNQHAMVQLCAAAAWLIIHTWKCIKRGQTYGSGLKVRIPFKSRFWGCFQRKKKRFTRRIELEGRLRSINADGDGSDGGHGLLQGVLVELSHVDVAGAFGSDVLGLEAAGAVLKDGQRVCDHL